MLNQYNSGAFIKKEIYQYPLKIQEYIPNQLKTAKLRIPKPIKSKRDDVFNNTTNYQIQNNYFIKAAPNQNDILFNKKINNKNTKSNISIDDNYINESYENDRYRVIVNRKKFSSGKNYNNNSIHFIKHYSNHNIDNQYSQRTINNEKDYSNHAFKISRDNTPKPINQKKILKPNYSSKIIYYNAYEKKFNDNQEKKQKENNINNDISLGDNNNNFYNYKIVDIKHKSSRDNFNMTTPNNTSVHTIVYTNKKDINLTPRNLFPKTEVKNAKKYCKRNKRLLRKK